MHKLILNTYGQYLYGVRLIFAESEIFIAIFEKKKTCLSYDGFLDC